MMRLGEYLFPTHVKQTLIITARLNIPKEIHWTKMQCRNHLRFDTSIHMSDSMQQVHICAEGPCKATTQSNTISSLLCDGLQQLYPLNIRPNVLMLATMNQQTGGQC